MKRNFKSRLHECLLTTPSLLMLLALVGIPTLVVVFTSFCNSRFGRTDEGFSLHAYAFLSDLKFWNMLWQSLLYTALTTVICVVVSIPVAYTIARCRGRLRTVLILSVIIPFWTNMIVHIVAWKRILHPDGFLRSALVWCGALGEDQYLLNTPLAVMLLFVYIFLPFAIIPLYATIEKFDFRLLESARDLGANVWQSVFRVFIPGIKGGIYSAAALVFIPVLGCYIVPEQVGGVGCDWLYANQIFQYTSTTSQNFPIAAALSSLLLLVMLGTWVGYKVYRMHAAADEEREELR